MYLNLNLGLFGNKRWRSLFQRHGHACSSRQCAFWRCWKLGHGLLPWSSWISAVYPCANVCYQVNYYFKIRNVPEFIDQMRYPSKVAGLSIKMIAFAVQAPKSDLYLFVRKNILGLLKRIGGVSSIFALLFGVWIGIVLSKY